MMNSNNGTRILVVEDDQDDSFLLTRQLAKAQIDDHVTVIGNGREAWEFLLNSTRLPIAIFLDLKLPELSGLELLERVRREPRLESLPVIVMTGSIDPNDLDRCFQLGVTAYLPKPIELRAFIKTVAHLFPKVTA